MVLKLFTYYVILLTFLRLHVEAQIIDSDIENVNKDLDELFSNNADTPNPSTPDGNEYKEERDKLKRAKDLPPGADYKEKMATYEQKLEAKVAFEYYINRRKYLKMNINQLIEIFDDLNKSETANILKNAIDQRNSYKEAAIKSALEDLAVDFTGTTDSLSTVRTTTTISTSAPSSLLNLLTKLLDSGASFFSPTLLNQINTAPAVNKDGNDDFNNLLIKLLKEIERDDDNDDDDDDWLEWIQWFKL